MSTDREAAAHEPAAHEPATHDPAGREPAAYPPATHKTVARQPAAHPSGARKRAVHSDDAPPPAGGYSKAIAAGPYLFTSGLGPQDPATGAVAATIEEQTRQVLANLRALLRADGLDLDDVVKSTVHLQHLKRDFAAYDGVYREHFREPLPVRTTVGSDLMDILVEIDVVALRRQD